MKKHTKRIVVAVVLSIIICVCCMSLISCDSSGGPCDSVDMGSFRNDTTLDLPLHVQRLKVSSYNEYYPIKCRLSLGEIYDEIKNVEGYETFMRGDYIVIEDRVNGASWTIGKTNHKSGIHKYNYYITNNGVHRSYMFPIYALNCEYHNEITPEMQQALPINCGIAEFERFYKLNGYEVTIDGNVMHIHDDKGVLYTDRDGNEEYTFDRVYRDFTLIFDNENATVRIELSTDFSSANVL